ncbi:Uncharacterised protein [Mycobacteroides abscessus subsp. abscessus]|nr:Uncharacterised protein [Mycobacteroides abscessus subsp. abscessus]
MHPKSVSANLVVRHSPRRGISPAALSMIWSAITAAITRKRRGPVSLRVCGMRSTPIPSIRLNAVSIQRTALSTRSNPASTTPKHSSADTA